MKIPTGIRTLSETMWGLICIDDKLDSKIKFTLENIMPIIASAAWSVMPIRENPRIERILHDNFSVPRTTAEDTISERSNQ